MSDAQVWKLGLLCQKNGKYVTQEAIGTGLNCASALFRKNQVFTVVQKANGKVNVVCPKGEMWTAGNKGTFSNNGSDSDDAEFEIVVQDDGTWAFKTFHGYYVSAEKETEMSAFARAITPTEKFAFHLALHPQVNIYSPARQSFAHVEANELRANEKVPWGNDAMIVMEFDQAKAKYTLRGANQKYWNCDSKFSDKPTDNSYYVAVLAEGDKVGFRGNNNKYMTAPTAKDQIMQCTSTECRTNEAFVLSDSHGQVTVTANNGKFLTMSRGQDPTVAGKKEALSDAEIFQMEYKGNGNWWFVTKPGHDDHGRVWSIGDASALTTFPKEKAGDAQNFQLEHYGKDICIKHGDKYLTYRPQGNVLLQAEKDENAKFSIDICNRPLLVLRCEFGFVSSKRANDQCACNSAAPETFILESKTGNYTFKGSNGKYWVVKDDGAIQCTGSTGDNFHLEWLAHTKFAIRVEKTGQYIKGGQQGGFLANSGTFDKDLCLWEY